MCQLRHNLSCCGAVHACRALWCEISGPVPMKVQMCSPNTAGPTWCMQDVDRAMDLAKEMRVRNVERNVHTYTALMNVCIKCGNCPLALDTYHHMRQDGTYPNVVTYNTLIECARRA